MTTLLLNQHCYTIVKITGLEIIIYKNGRRKQNNLKYILANAANSITQKHSKAKYCDGLHFGDCMQHFQRILKLQFPNNSKLIKNQSLFLVLFLEKWPVALSADSPQLKHSGFVFNDWCLKDDVNANEHKYGMMSWAFLFFTYSSDFLSTLLFFLALLMGHFNKFDKQKGD